MEEKIVSFEVAKLAHTLGFPQSYKDIQKAYTLDGCHLTINSCDGEYYKVFNEGEIVYNISEYSLIIPAPTQSQMQKWLRDVKNIDINICRDYSEYRIDCIDSDLNKSFSKINGFMTYEYALENAIIKSIKYLLYEKYN